MNEWMNEWMNKYITEWNLPLPPGALAPSPKRRWALAAAQLFPSIASTCTASEGAAKLARLAARVIAKRRARTGSWIIVRRRMQIWGTRDREFRDEGMREHLRANGSGFVGLDFYHRPWKEKQTEARLRSASGIYASNKKPLLRSLPFNAWRKAATKARPKALSAPSSVQMRAKGA